MDPFVMGVVAFLGKALAVDMHDIAVFVVSLLACSVGYGLVYRFSRP